MKTRFIWREPLIYCGVLLVIAKARDCPVGFQSICSVEFEANASNVCSSASTANLLRSCVNCEIIPLAKLPRGVISFPLLAFA